MTGEAAAPIVASGHGTIEGSEPGAQRLDEVHILGLPLALYLETEQHNDALMRELGLIVLSTSHGDSRSAVPRRLLELAGEIRSVFQPATGGVRAPVERAIQLGQPNVDLIMNVPEVGLGMLLRLGEQLDEADRYCEQGQLLTFASSPVVRRLRRWYAQEVADQLVGRPPRPWSAANP